MAGSWGPDHRAPLALAQPRSAAKLPGLMRAKEDNTAGDVDAVFAAYPPALRKKLKSLRRLILETAKKTAGVGPLEETLKWGQPSYLPVRSGSGTTVRIDQVKGQAHRYAM